MRRKLFSICNNLNVFDFKPIGQGLFYTGSLNHGQYNFVFDCGTESKGMYLINQIDEHVKFLQHGVDGKPYIDFIVISHLHFDHFSGLYYLLQKCNVGKIYLPYLGTDRNIIRTTLALAVYGQIMDIEQREERDFDLTAIFKLMCRLYRIDDYNDENWHIEKIVFINEENKDYIKKANGKIYSVKEEVVPINECEAWHFSFIQKSVDLKTLNLLGEKIEDEFGIFSAAELINLLSTSENNIKILKRIYESVFGRYNKLNLTSIVLVHFPLYTRGCLFAFNYKYAFNFVGRSNCGEVLQSSRLSNDNIVSILTGDAMIDDVMAREIKSVMQWRKFIVLQVPHHGSRDNWLEVKRNGIKAPINIVSFGYGNKHKLPHVNTVDDMIENNIFYYFVTQDRAFRYFIG